MADKIRIKAAEGRRVLDRVTRKPIPAEGIDVSPDDVFWFKRLRHGDVVEVKAASNAATPATAPRTVKE